MNDFDEMIPTRRSLLSRLKDWNDQESWREFFDKYWRLIYRVAIKSGLSEQEAQDVVQETLKSVANSMPTFEYDPQKGSFKNWLLQLTKWRIIDQLRKRQREIQHSNREDQTSTGTATIERVPDPAGLDLDAVWEKEWQINLMEAAIARVKRTVDAKHFQIFDLYVTKQWSVAKVARTLGINRAQVYLAKHRITKLIQKEIDYRQAKPI